MAAAHHVQRPAADLAAVAVHREPGRDALHLPLGVLGEADPHVRVERLVDAAEGEAHLRQRLVAHPLLGDGAHLRHQRPPLLGQRDHAERDALLARLVERRAHVLPGLAAELQVREVDEGVLGDLHPLPAQRARRVRGLLRRREQARHPAAALAQRRRTPARPRPDPPPVPPGRRGRSRRLRAAGRRRTTRPSGVRNQVFSGQVAIHDSVPPPLFCSICTAVGWSIAVVAVLRRTRRRDGTRKARRPTMRMTKTRRPQQLVGGEARQPVVDVEVAAEDRDEDAEHGDERAPRNDVEARDDDGEPPGQPLAPAEAPDQEQDEDQRDARGRRGPGCRRGPGRVARRPGRSR